MPDETAHILQVITEVRDNASAGLKRVGDAGGVMGQSVKSGAATAAASMNDITVTTNRAVDSTDKHTRGSEAHSISLKSLSKSLKDASKGFLLMGGAADGAAAGISGLLSSAMRGFASGGLIGLGLVASTKLISMFGKETAHAREELEKFGEKAKENFDRARDAARDAEKDVAMLKATMREKDSGSDDGDAARAEGHKYEALKRTEEVSKNIEESKRAQHELDQLIIDDYEGWFAGAQTLNDASRQSLTQVASMAVEYRKGNITLEQMSRETIAIARHSSRVAGIIGEDILKGMQAYLLNTEAVGELTKRNALEEQKYSLERAIRDKERADKLDKERRKHEEIVELVREETNRIEQRASADSSRLKDLEHEWAIEDERKKLSAQNVDSRDVDARIAARDAEYAARKLEAEYKIAEAKEKSNEAGLKSIENEIRKNTLTKEALTLAEREERYWNIRIDFGKKVADEWLVSVKHVEKMIVQTEILTKKQKEYEENVKAAAKAHESIKESNIDIILQIGKMQAEIDGGVAGLKEWERTNEIIKMQNEGINQDFIDQFFALKDILDLKHQITDAEKELADAEDDTTEKTKAKADKKDKDGKDKDGKKKKRKTGGIFGVTFGDPNRQGGLANTLRRSGDDEDSPTHKAAKKTADAAGKAADKGKEKDAEAAKKIEEAGKKIHALSDQLEKGQITAERFQVEVAETLKAFKDIHTKAQETTNKKIQELKDIVATLKKAMDGLTKGTGKK